MEEKNSGLAGSFPRRLTSHQTGIPGLPYPMNLINLMDRIVISFVKQHWGMGSIE